jgi:hypothetical protein
MLLESMKCTYLACNNSIEDFTTEMCYSCINKILRYESALEFWLETNYPNYVLDDIIGWYCKCANYECERDCLEQGPYVQGCICCPCLLKIDYLYYKIDFSLMPTHEWMSNIENI